MDYEGDSGGGGGFNSTSSSTNNFGGGSSQQSQRTRLSYDEQTLIPVTIAMALKSAPSSGDDNSNLQCLADGRKAATVILVGAVRSHQDLSTNVLYELEDGTGLIEVKQWLDDNDPTIVGDLRKETLKENSYVKVVGQIKDYDGKKLLVANSVRAVSTGNELSHHMLQVVYSAESHKRADSIVAQPMGTTPMITSPTTKAVLGTGTTLKEKVLDYFKREGGMWKTCVSKSTARVRCRD